MSADAVKLKRAELARLQSLERSSAELVTFLQRSAQSFQELNDSSAG